MYKLRLPAIVVNFKCYLEATGDKALNLTQLCQKVSDETGISIAIAPQFSDLAKLTGEISIPVFSQHIDNIKPGSFTGHILPEAIKAAGAIGTLINHSERKLSLDSAKACITRCNEVDLESIVCADRPETCSKLAEYNPDIIAIEPPELIGSGIPVSKAKPEVVSDTVKAVSQVNTNIPVLCGAGISTGSDINAALKLGTQGVLLASGVVKAKNPYVVLVEMANAISKIT